MTVENKKKGMASLIKDFFGMDAATAVKEYKQLSSEDKAQIASAIAREIGLTQDDVSFTLVPY